ncbi:unnamed protein product [Acanthoscelides obtectus]|uniref:Uncharacterized protein n=1 Tax=Acanthoscelides obtectus TaxID=200917 RepID=A0A9P0Q9R5_ACAOB|nr:unnamed protein product [Acanthoscelides obtectus]CAK1663249.1 hypothetical protein AOBTE_LOCUS23571 [Acanthoscelides obtectus]
MGLILHKQSGISDITLTSIYLVIGATFSIVASPTTLSRCIIVLITIAKRREYLHSREPLRTIVWGLLAKLADIFLFFLLERAM